MYQYSMVFHTESQKGAIALLSRWRLRPSGSQRNIGEQRQHSSGSQQSIWNFLRDVAFTVTVLLFFLGGGGGDMDIIHFEECSHNIVFVTFITSF